MRDDREIWELVSYDPLCFTLASLHRTLVDVTLGARTEFEIMKAMAALHTMVRELTYDRIEGGVT